MQTPAGFNYLLQHLPKLAVQLPRIPLGNFPTRVERVHERRCRLYVKHDSESDHIYGGNKLRKLEYLFGQAFRQHAASVATFGSVGSNHALATAIHARRLGFRPIAFLSRQRRTPAVTRTLDLHRRLGTKVVYWGGPAPTRRAIVRETMRAQKAPTWVFPPGGSSWIGAIGYLGAAFELRHQIDAGQLPVPDRIYVPLGTMGTAAGLSIGLAAAGIESTLVAVRVVEEFVANRTKFSRYCEKIRTLCARYEPRIAELDWSKRLEFRDEQLGQGYAHATPAAIMAVAIASAAWRLSLETTYSGKAMAALLTDRDQGGLDGKNVLFWNTYNSVTAEPAVPVPERSGLPPELQMYTQ